MRLLLTGASGFLGRNLLLAMPKGWKTVAVYHRSRDFVQFLRQNRLQGVRALQCDLSEARTLKRQGVLTRGSFDTCLYLAANGDPTFSVKDPEQDFRRTTLTLLNLLSHVKIRRLLYVSSGAVYEGHQGRVSPTSRLSPRLPYAISHLAAEYYVQSFWKLKKNPKEYLIVRFFGAYGPYEPPRKIYTRLVRAFGNRKSRTFTIRGNGKNLIDAMSVTDAVQALLRALQSPLKNRTFDLCSGRPLSIEALVRRAASTFGVIHLKIRKEGTTVEPIHFRTSTQFQKKHLHFTPKVPLEVGLQRFASFLKSERV